MLSILLFLAIISTGGILGASKYKKKYEELLPITCSAVVLILFIFGLLGQLKIGVIFIILLSIAIHVFALCRIIIKHNISEFISCFFSKGFWIFVFFSILFLYFDKGLLVHAWDEFSHWADIVKAMTYIDDFGTNPLSDSLFQSYPPGMSLFQYFFQKINMLCNRNNVFSEWRIYFAYQVFLISFFVPFISQRSSKRPIVLFISVMAIFLAPMAFFEKVYTTIYIDPILGILSGMGLYIVFAWKEKDIFYSIYILSICSMLVLMKDVGFIFALLLAFTYATDMLLAYLQNNESVTRSMKIIKFVLIYGVTVCSVLIPKILWKNEINISGANQTFSDKLNLVKLAEILLDNKESYQKQVIMNYGNAFIGQRLYAVPNLNISIPYLILFIFFVVFLGGLWKIYKDKEDINNMQNTMIIIVCIIQMVVYIIGLCFTYVLNFSEYEALNLASFERYLNIVFLSIWIVIIMLSIDAVQKFNDIKKRMGLCVLCLLIFFTPAKSLYELVTKQHVVQANERRDRYVELCSKIMRVSDEESRVYLISQEDSGFDYWEMKFNIRPNYSNENFSWSIGKSFFEGDIYTKKMTALQWQEELLAEYDYVALYHLNDYFYHEFSVLFTNPNDIEENVVYRINKTTGLLEKCE